jgi:hypothetical protein
MTPCWTRSSGQIDFPWPDALQSLGADFPEPVRNLKCWAGGWWRYVDGHVERSFLPLLMSTADPNSLQAKLDLVC